MFFGQYQLWKRHLDLESLQKDKSKKNERYLKSFVAGAVSLFTAWMIIFPLDVIKTQIQSADLRANAAMSKGQRQRNRNLYYNFEKRYRLHGLNGFYSGLGVTLMRTIPAGGMSFVAYEMMKDNISNGCLSKNHE